MAGLDRTCTFYSQLSKTVRIVVGFLPIRYSFSHVLAPLDTSANLALIEQDEADIDESWSFPGNLEDAYKVIEGWDPLCKAIIEKTPSIVDWKLVYRDPLPSWVSNKGRIALLGDSAHPFLPTSVQGATQAMEDGVVLAVCLSKGGMANVPNAVRAYQEIRYALLFRNLIHLTKSPQL